MAYEQEFAPVEAPEPEIPSDKSAEREPEAALDEGSRMKSDAEPEERAAAKSALEEAGCPIEMDLDGVRCGCRLHSASPQWIDEEPVCLMHSKDERKQSGPLMEEFWRIFEQILDEARDREAHFDKFVFPKLDLSGRTFKAICRFDQATFTQEADFNGAAFTKEASFKWALFRQCADFSGATFTKDVNFMVATFKRDADFGGATFTQEAHFSVATFEQNADFSRTTFTQNAGFGATFRKTATFVNATFKQGAYFLQDTFEQSADFSIATFAQNAYFREATFKRDADFGFATFTQDADFARTNFYGTSYWRECRFLGRAEFRHTKFQPKEEGMPSAVFSLAQFAKPKEVVFDDVDLRRTLFLNCDVSEFSFTSSVQWAKRDGNRGLAVFEEKILPDQVLCKDIEWRYGSIDHGAVGQIYHQLKKNYDTRLDYRKADDFHFGEMEMRRLEPATNGPLLGLRRRLRPWVGPEAWYKYASDYGNSYVKPILWLFGTLVLFAALFPVPGLESKQQKPQPAENYASVWNKQDTWANNLWTEGKLLRDSAIAAVDIATFQRNPEHTPVYPGGRILAILETLLTSTLFGLFLLAIRRQFRR